MSTPGPQLVLGTTNAGKLRELAELLDPFGIPCRSLAGLAGSVDVAETGGSFAENAALKASTQATALGQWVLAEDSGLVVDALGGAPGIFSARFSDPGATDARNNALLLERLAAVPHHERTAHYACHAALADPSGQIVAVSSGTCGGRIATEFKGTGGFGYDPLFIVPEYHRTFGELAPAVKAIISHRARALRSLMPTIRRLLGAASGTGPVAAR
jgi:XTP/dITP diphosphohydrolase